MYGNKGAALTDAPPRKIGKLEMARRGTIYFDEIAALAPNLQAKLLRAIQERRYTRLGGTQSIELEARVILSSNRSTDALRRDLLYRINVVTISLPPLCERRDDIPALAKQFLRRAKLTTEALDLLC